MGRWRVALLILGIPGLLGFGALAAAQWRGADALTDFAELQKKYPPDSMKPSDAKIVTRKQLTLARADRLVPDLPEVHYQRALLFLVLAETESLHPAAESGRVAPSPDLIALLREALRSINHAILLNPGSAEYHFVKATILQNLEANLSPEQLEASGKAVAQLLTISDSLDPYKPQLHYRIGSFWLALGDRQSAKKSLAVALMDSFNYSRPVFDLLWSSVEDVRELSSLVGSAPLARALLGNFLWMRGYRAESEEQFKHLEGLQELDYLSGEALIAHCIRERQFERARSIVSKLQKTRAFRPAFNQARLEYFRGKTYLQESQYQRAIESFERSMRLDPANIQSHLDLAEAYLGEGQAEKAIARWRYVLSRWPKLPAGIAIPGQVHFGLGRAYEAVGDAQRALAEYLQASSEDPGNVSFSQKASEITKGL